jgi:hypothetical protein
MPGSFFEEGVLPKGEAGDAFVMRYCLLLPYYSQA